MAMSWRNLIVGSPLRTAEQAHQRLTKTKALAIFSSDALSSVAYATDEILLVLVAAGCRHTRNTGVEPAAAVC